jgi:hypothetical protein
LDLNDCDGASASVVANTLCSVPTANLLAAPFSLSWGSSVTVKIYASNKYGDSASSQGNGALLLTNPAAPVLTQSATQPSPTAISLDWNLPYNGGSSILDYKLQVMVSGSWTDAASGLTGLTYSYGPTVNAETYTFRI